jgi:hypothetical protein
MIRHNRNHGERKSREIRLLSWGNRAVKPSAAAVPQLSPLAAAGLPPT